jgi:hypothetical protein
MTTSAMSTAVRFVILTLLRVINLVRTLFTQTVLVSASIQNLLSPVVCPRLLSESLGLYKTNQL